MQTVKVLISNTEEAQLNRKSIEEYISKANGVFKPKGFYLEMEIESSEAPTGCLMRHLVTPVQIDKKSSTIFCQFTNIDNFSLELIISLGSILDYNLPDITDIKENKLSIEQEDMINFNNVPLFSENPSICELNEQLKLYSDTEDEELLKRKSEIVQNIKRYHFMVYNWLNFKFNFEHLTPNFSSVQTALQAYDAIFNIKVPISARIDDSIRLFNEAVALSGRENKIMEGIELDILKAFSELLVVFEKYDLAMEVLDRYHSMAEGLDLSKDIKRRHQIIVCYNYKSVLYFERQMFDKAIENYYKSAELTADLFGDKHVDIVGYWNLIVSFYETQGKYEMAIKLLKKVLSSQKKIYGPKSDATITIKVIMKKQKSTI